MSGCSSEKNSIISIYTELAKNPDRDFGWEKGIDNARRHGYKKEWLETIPDEVWKYCAAVGNPFSIAEIPAGATVLDIGCGAGIDLCVASLIVGKKGNVFGVDITPAMVELARKNARLAGLDNIRVFEASGEKIPLDDSSVDVVISNGAINLSSSKKCLFAEIYRVLKTGGKLIFADMTRVAGKTAVSESCGQESWADCVAGTVSSEELISIMLSAGLTEAGQTGTTHYKTSDSTLGALFRAVKG